jgi:hypothetical protein
VNFTGSGTREYAVNEPEYLYPVADNNCATKLMATNKLLIVACPENGVLEIYLADSLDLVTQITEFEGVGFGENIQLIDTGNSKQYFIFLTPNDVDEGILMVEILVNPLFSANNQYVNAIHLLDIA